MFIMTKRTSTLSKSFSSVPVHVQRVLERDEAAVGARLRVTPSMTLFVTSRGRTVKGRLETMSPAFSIPRAFMTSGSVRASAYISSPVSSSRFLRSSSSISKTSQVALLRLAFDYRARHDARTRSELGDRA